MSHDPGLTQHAPEPGEVGYWANAQAGHLDWTRQPTAPIRGTRANCTSDEEGGLVQVRANLTDWTTMASGTRVPAAGPRTTADRSASTGESCWS